MAATKTRVRTEVTVDAELFAAAEAHGISISETLDEALEEKLRAARREAYRRENAAAYEAARERFEKEGLLLGEYRTF